MLPAKLQHGSHIRVISPAISLAIINEETRHIADDRLQQLGLQVSFSRHADEITRFNTSSIVSRVADLHDAFRDPSVNAILTTLGGFNSHQLLDYLDYDLIAANPKILCGFSDITALVNAIYAKTGMITYSGPHYATLGMKQGNEYTLDYLQKCLFNTDPYTVEPAPTWSDDKWSADQDTREFVVNEGYVVLQAGEAAGTLIGGNTSTLILLNGTAYQPSFADSLLLIEDHFQAQPAHFDRYLQALIHQSAFKGVRGLIIGRFQKASNTSLDDLRYIISTKRELRGLPVIANASFGHTTPLFTFPIGGYGTLTATADSAEFRITKH